MAHIARKDPPHFVYFPGNYRWSAAMLSMLSSAAWGGSDINEVDRIGRLLKNAKMEDDDAWFHACVQVADGVRATAKRFEDSGHRHAAAPFYLRACKYYQMGERFRTPKDEIALAAYKKSIECFHSFVKLTDVKIEIVEVPYAGGSMPGYFLHANNAEGKRSPCVVHFDGLDITKEMLYMRGVPELPKRGISVLIMDGPGTGEAIRFRKHYLRHDYEVAGSACVGNLRVSASPCCLLPPFKPPVTLGQHFPQPRRDVFDLLPAHRVRHAVLVPVHRVAETLQDLLRLERPRILHHRVTRAVAHQKRHVAIGERPLRGQRVGEGKIA